MQHLYALLHRNNNKNSAKVYIRRRLFNVSYLKIIYSIMLCTRTAPQKCDIKFFKVNIGIFTVLTCTYELQVVNKATILMIMADTVSQMN
jgi:hypothetical protein